METRKRFATGLALMFSVGTLNCAEICLRAFSSVVLTADAGRANDRDSNKTIKSLSNERIILP